MINKYILKIFFRVIIFFIIIMLLIYFFVDFENIRLFRYDAF